MRVVEQQHVISATGPVSADAFDQRMSIPLVNEHERGAVQGFVEIERIRIDALRGQRRIRAVELLDRARTGIRQQVRQAPGVDRLIHPYLVAARQQLRGDAPQKMCVAVIPVGNERMTEENHTHSGYSSPAVPVSWVASAR